MKFKDLLYKKTEPVVEWKLKDQVYRFNTNIILSSVLIMLVLAIGILWYYEGLDGFDMNKKFYVSCQSDMGCENPLYQNMAYCGSMIASNDPICNKEYLIKGETYGEAPPKIFRYFTLIVLSILLLAFVVNHFVMNREFSFKELFKEANLNLEDEEE